MPRCPAALVDETSTFFPLSDEKFSSNVEGLISGVTYIHNSGMVHVDIKAGNIFIQPDGSWILGDYGSTVVINGEILEATTNRYPVGLHNQQAKVEFDWYHLWEAMLMFLLQEKWAELFEENRISTAKMIHFQQSLPQAKVLDNLYHWAGCTVGRLDVIPNYTLCPHCLCPQDKQHIQEEWQPKILYNVQYVSHLAKT
eukprot:TRINITY_DN3502_c0_g1_i10.p1 TRINITY_DN3502_c0_g1~~TRINITY_DN3502_c0_g1_i10.p1  ORF type:complete len:198 (+),score=31.45 TRINITY_DN3502_c0_g1_i10:110-703(+)